MDKKIDTVRGISRKYTVEHDYYYQCCMTLKEFEETANELWVNYDWLIGYLSTHCICPSGNEGFCLMCDIINKIKSIAKLSEDTKNV